MNIRSKKLITYALIALVLPFVSLMTLNNQEVAAESPTITYKEVTSTASFRIDVTVDLTLTGFNYDYFIENLRMYLNQSEDTILANDYDDFNASITLDRQTTETFEARILSPALADQSAYYNITLVAITNTDEKSALTVWDGGYYFIDIDQPTVNFITPAVGFLEIWNNYTVSVEIKDESNLSLVRFFVNNQERYRIEDPTPGQEIFNWSYECYKEVGLEPIIKVEAVDDTVVGNTKINQTTVKVVGPKVTYLEPIPPYIDSNDTLMLNLSIIDINDTPKNISEAKIQYSIDDGVWTSDVFIANATAGTYNYTFPEYPVGTKIQWRVFANNTAGQYHIWKDNNYEPYVIYSEYPDHIDPTGEVEYESQVLLGETPRMALNVTEQSPVNSCLLNYQIEEQAWQEVSLNNISAGVNNTWFYYEYNFSDSLPVFTYIYFYVWLNDSGGNELLLDNSGDYYTIRILPSDQTAPNITIIESPETITRGQNITITVEVNETSTITSVQVIYTINDIQFIKNMTNTEGNIWTVSFIINGSTGDEVEIFVRVIDEFYNTGVSDVLQYELQTAKEFGSHSNAWLWLMLLGLLIIPIVITFVILKPQR